MQLPDLKEARKRTKAEVDVVRFNKEDKYKNIVKDKYYFVKTYGCQMNEHDSENIKAMLEYMGYKNTDTLEKSDIVILNTCSIRENANNKVFFITFVILITLFVLSYYLLIVFLKRC